MPPPGLRVCAYPGCPELSKTRLCPTHTQDYNKTHRPEARSRRIYDSKRWKAVRKQVLQRDGWRCQHAGCTRWATDVDHIIPLRDLPKGDPYDMDNLQALCHEHHSMKTAEETWRR